MTLETIDTAVEEPPLPEPPADPVPPLSDATRYLCVGAYTDTTFRNRCLREVYYQDKRFVAPSYGFSLLPVLDACVGARNIDIVRDVAIVVTLGVAAYLNWISVAAVGAALVCLWVTRPAARLIRDFGKRVVAGTAVDKTKSPARGLFLLLGFAASWIVFVALASRAVSAATTTFTGARTMSGGAALLVAPTVLALPAIFALVRQRRIDQFAQFGDHPRPRDNDRMQMIDEQGGGNTVVYHNFEPFIGAGDVVDTWGFATRLVRRQADVTIAGERPLSDKEREYTEPPFKAHHIVDYVKGQLTQLTRRGRAELRIPEMRVVDRIFQSDRERGPRSTETSADEIVKIVRNPTGPARHYIVCQVVGWGGDIVTTVHVHIAVQGRSLYLEVTTTSLAPCNERYRSVDGEDGTGPRAWMTAVGRAVTSTPRTILRAPHRLVGSLLDMTGRRGWGNIRRSRFRDHGAVVSVRQLGTRDKLRNFTQGQDILKFKRLIERRVFDHVLDFLDERKVDTTEYRARATSVLNVSGGVNNWGTAQYHGDVAGGGVNKAA